MHRSALATCYLILFCFSPIENGLLGFVCVTDVHATHYRVRARDARRRVPVMHAGLKPPQTSTPHNSATMSPIEAALAEVKARKPGQDLCYTTIAAKYDVNRSTLSRRHRAVTTSRAAKSTNQQKLNPQQEQELVQYTEGLTR
jgi:hypothetical protein